MNVNRGGAPCERLPERHFGIHEFDTAVRSMLDGKMFANGPSPSTWRDAHVEFRLLAEGMIWHKLVLAVCSGGDVNFEKKVDSKRDRSFFTRLNSNYGRHAQCVLS